MKEKEKTSAYTNIESEFVEAEGFKWSDLINKEDWLAIWIGFIIIAIGAFAVITGSFDFSAAKFSTWGNGTSVLEQLNSEFALKLIRTFVVLAVLFTAGAVLKGQGIKKYLPAFAVLFVLAIIVRFISAQYTMNRYLEWAFWALIVGLLISNSVGVPNWLKPAVQTEYYIKAGLVIMGFSVLFSNIVSFGLYG
ncbi:MAG: putative sulfate exporter family transporter, partial [Clostridiales bacterium]|nr:putative sulfate exporter family transporter [Clostridiales bacterium]